MLVRPATPEDLDRTRALFREYSQLVADGICFQSFERELADLPGSYAPPGGTLLLAFIEEHLAGCVALRQLTPNAGEMKRLYVRPTFQGHGLGRILTERIIEESRRLGYEFLRLDTLPHLDRAIQMYRAMGFQGIPPYADNPPKAICFELRIR